MAKKLDGDKNLCERELLEKILGIVEKQLQFLRRFHYDAFAIGDELPKQEGGGYV